MPDFYFFIVAHYYAKVNNFLPVPSDRSCAARPEKAELRRRPEHSGHLRSHRENTASEQSHLAGIRHSIHGAGGFEQLDMGLGHLGAGGGELLY